MLMPKQISLDGKDHLKIVWNNEKEHKIPLTLLRDESPDAMNKGETILWRHYDAPKKEDDKPGKYEIQGIETVGSYAISITWKDGNNYGIYSWDLLWRLGEYCEVKGNLHQDFEHNHDEDNNKED
jgi:DUF971 family protein